METNNRNKVDNRKELLDAKQRNEVLKQELQQLLAAYSDLAGPESIVVKLGLQLVDCDVVQREVVCSATVQEWQLNPLQILHGGMMATMFDSVFGVSVRGLAQEQNISTIHLGVSYLLPVALGQEVRLKSHITFLGRTIVHLVGEAMVGDALVATATAEFVLLDRREQNKLVFGNNQ